MKNKKCEKSVLATLHVLLRQSLQEADSFFCFIHHQESNIFCWYNGLKSMTPSASGSVPCESPCHYPVNADAGAGVFLENETFD